MYVVTFYSFKGGVGRTLALVNIGVHLAQLGKRVLLVDFDLEAPGIGTFESLAKPSKDSLGLVDYVSDYLQTGRIPSLEDYVYSPTTEFGSGSLWIMPSGKQDPGYASRLNSINWLDLYRDKSGYLFFEELKARWMAKLKPDYVLIDSRTGHTDIGGICTRQLPDAVVILFVPNVQNLSGLERVVADIDFERSNLDKKINLHFIMSNVPDLDDEDSILEHHLAAFKKSLHFSELTGTVHHYPSLQLLDQAIFAKERPRSRLAKEYKQIAKKITEHNWEDRDGVVSLLNSAQITNIDALNRIRAKHGSDREVVYALANTYDKYGLNDEAYTLFAQAASLGYRSAHLYLRHAELGLRRGDNNPQIVSDLSQALASTKATWADVSRIVQLMSRLSPKDLELLPSSSALKSLTTQQQCSLAGELAEDRVTSPVAERIISSLIAQTIPAKTRDHAIHALSLILIATGRFTAAKSTLDSAGRAGLASAFNFAIADWGEKGAPSVDLFEQVVTLIPASPSTTSEDQSPNYCQCFALANWGAGNSSRAFEWLGLARRIIRNQPTPEFSAWRYWKVSPLEFVTDLDQIEELFHGGSVVPIFMQQGILKQPQDKSS